MAARLSPVFMFLLGIMLDLMNPLLTHRLKNFLCCSKEVWGQLKEHQQMDNRLSGLLLHQEVLVVVLLLLVLIPVVRGISWNLLGLGLDLTNQVTFTHKCVPSTLEVCLLTRLGLRLTSSDI